MQIDSYNWENIIRQDDAVHLIKNIFRDNKIDAFSEGFEQGFQKGFHRGVDIHLEQLQSSEPL